MQVFNTLQTTEDREAFQAQWKIFMSGLEAADRHLALKTLQDSILANLVAYRQDIEALMQEEQLSKEDRQALSIPVPAAWLKRGSRSAVSRPKN